MKIEFTKASSEGVPALKFIKFIKLGIHADPSGESLCSGLSSRQIRYTNEDDEDGGKVVEEVLEEGEGEEEEEESDVVKYCRNSF